MEPALRGSPENTGDHGIPRQQEPNWEVKISSTPQYSNYSGSKIGTAVSRIPKVTFNFGVLSLRTKRPQLQRRIVLPGRIMEE